MQRKAGLFMLCVVATMPVLYFLAPQLNTSPAVYQVSSRREVTIANTAGTRQTQSWYQDPGGDTWKPRKLLIFTYARSGSSLTGAIVRHSKEVFYTYEPLYGLSTVKGPQKKQRHRQLLQAIFDCNFSTRAIIPLAQNFLMTRFPETTLILRCFQFLIKGAVQAAQWCFRIAEQVCKSYRFHSVKVIRMAMDEVGDIMTSNPDLAVIFLVRDPRASTWSSMTVFKSPTLETMRPEVANHCRTMTSDLTIAQQLFRLYPHRLRFLRYEDLAKHPLRVSRNLYQFLHLNWTTEVAQRIKYQTSAKPKMKKNKKAPLKRVPFFERNDSFSHRGYSYSTERENSAVAAAQWKTDIPISVVRTVQKECSHLLTLLGYRRFDSLEDFGQFHVSADTLSFKLGEKLPYWGDLNY